MSDTNRPQPGWPRAYPVAQPPNAPLLVVFAAAVVSWVTDGSVRDYARAVLYAALAGVGLARAERRGEPRARLLGRSALAYVVVRVGRAL